MNEERTVPEFSPQILKILFGRLVKEFGGQEAAAAECGVARQYIGQMASRNPENASVLPRWEYAFALEAALGRSIVFAGLASISEPATGNANACAIAEANDVVRAAADAVAKVIEHQNGSVAPEVLHQAMDVVERELSEARRALPSRDAKVVPFRGEASQ